MLTELLSNAFYVYSVGNTPALFAGVPDKKLFMIEITEGPQALTDVEKAAIITTVWHEALKQEWNITQGFLCEYWYNWEERQKDPKTKSELFDYPSFDGIASMCGLTESVYAKFNEGFKRDLLNIKQGC